MNRSEGGRIALDGRDLALRSNRDAVNAGIAYVSEDRLSLGVVLPQSIEDNIILAVMKRLTGRFGLMPAARRRKLAADWVRRLAVKVPGLDRPVQTLSGGNQQRVVLAKWLATRPKVLILDSPTVGVDVGARAGIFRIVRDLADQGLAILLISDEATEGLYNSDRVLHMAHGRIVGEFDPRTTTVQAMEEAIYE
jgi:simple sugar transport system ATP-binding protein